jgi:hypothetical protein
MTNEYIKKEDVIKIIKSLLAQKIVNEKNVLDDTNTLSTIEIVHCKDCKYEDGTCYCEMLFMDTFPEGFCHLGSKKNNHKG